MVRSSDTEKLNTVSWINFQSPKHCCDYCSQFNSIEPFGKWEERIESEKKTVCHRRRHCRPNQPNSMRAGIFFLLFGRSIYVSTFLWRPAECFFKLTTSQFNPIFCLRSEKCKHQSKNGTNNYIFIIICEISSHCAACNDRCNQTHSIENLKKSAE